MCSYKKRTIANTIVIKLISMEQRCHGEAPEGENELLSLSLVFQDFVQNKQISNLLLKNEKDQHI